MSLVWWWGVRGKDFLTPPDEQTLAAVRESAMKELKATESISGEDSPKAIKAKPAKLHLPETEAPAPAPLDLGDLTIAPALDCYLPQAAKGAEGMIELATQLETKGELQRSLLAWERVIDSTPATPEQHEAARKSIQRLRAQLPIWNVDPIAAQPLILQVSCDRDRAKTLEPMVQEIARQLNDASSGLLDCKVELKEGPKPSANAPRQPVALWFCGSSADAAQSKILTLPVLPESAEEQRQLLLGNLYKLIRDGVNTRAPLQPLIEWQPGTDPVPLLNSAITRHTWSVWSGIFAGKS